jgi:hypothetical protein
MMLFSYLGVSARRKAIIAISIVILTSRDSTEVAVGLITYASTGSGEESSPSALLSEPPPTKPEFRATF